MVLRKCLNLPRPLVSMLVSLVGLLHARLDHAEQDGEQNEGTERDVCKEEEERGELS